MRYSKEIYGFVYALLCLFMVSCQATKYIPSGDKLYVGSKVKIEEKLREKKTLQKDLETQLRPKPNTTFLGVPYKVLIYNLKSKSGRGVGAWLSRKFGEEPVLLSRVNAAYNERILVNRLENQGYFRARAKVDPSVTHRKAKQVYYVWPGPSYHIRSVNFFTDSSLIGKTIAAQTSTSLLKVGNCYRLDDIKMERQRVCDHLKEQGFYYFIPDYIFVEADSMLGSNQVDLTLKVKENIPAEEKLAYSIHSIQVYPDFSLNDTLSKKGLQYNLGENYTIHGAVHVVRPQVFRNTILFHPGDLYRQSSQNLSLQRLLNLGTFKFVKNRFMKVNSDSVGAPSLDAYYYLSPYPRKSIRAELSGKTNTANFTGSEVKLSWRNRNTFRRAEAFTASAYVGADMQFSGDSNGKDIVLRAGLEAKLVFPRLITPFKFYSLGAYMPRTKIATNYDLVNRFQAYALNSFSTSFSYTWKPAAVKEHQLSVFSADYVHPSYISKAYAQAANTNADLQNAVKRQFTFGPNYRFIFNAINRSDQTHTFYESYAIDLSGNIIGLLSGANQKKGRTKLLFGAAYAQYVEVGNEFRHYWRFNSKALLASRFITNLGLPYGNSMALPFIKQSFIGGASSLRAFRARSIGPGVYHDSGGDPMGISTDQSGDIKLEVNTECRSKLFSILYGALFIDAGNIWMLNNDPNRPGSRFSKNFIAELAVGTGAGLRADLSFLILRLDVAFPLREPWLPSGHRWVTNQIDFSSAIWRKNNLMYNLAIGYPF